MLLPLNDKRLWAEAVSTFVYLKNRQPHKSVKDQTPYEAFLGKKPSIHHLQPFGRECYVHIPEDKRPAGSKLSPRAMKGIFIGYTATDRHYRVFLPSEKRTVVSYDVFFPPLATEGVPSVPEPLSSSSSSTQFNDPQAFQPSTSLSYNLNKEGFPTSDMWIAWINRNPETAADWYQRGHPIVTALMNHQLDEERKNDALFSPPSNTSSTQSNTKSEINQELFSGFSSMQQQQQHQDSVQSNGSSSSSSPSLPPQHNYPRNETIISFHDSFRPSPPRTRLRTGTAINPPGEWWKAPLTRAPSPPPLASSDQQMTDAS